MWQNDTLNGRITEANLIQNNLNEAPLESEITCLSPFSK